MMEEHMKSDSLAIIAGKNFKILLANKGITQEQAASILARDERTIRRWISSGIDRLSILEEISEKFEVDLIKTFFKAPNNRGCKKT